MGPSIAYAATYRVIQIEEDDPRWHQFVASHPDRSVFHHPAWSRALMEEYGRKPFVLAAEDPEGKLLGILPLLDTRGMPFNAGEHIIARRLASLPRTPVAGPLSTGREITQALVHAAVARAQECHLMLQLKTLANTLDGLVDGLIGVPWKQAYVIRLPQPGTELRFGNARKTHRVKWAVNKAVKSGVTVQWADAEAQLHAWYELYVDTMRWHGSLPRPYRFFASLWRGLHPGGLMRLLLAYQEQHGAARMLSGCLYLISGRSFYCWLNGRRRDQLDFHPNDAIHWEGISAAWKEGFELYDFGEVDEDQRGLIEFKSKWGAEPQRSYRYYYPPPKNLCAPVPVPDGFGRRGLRGLWRHVPLPMTVRIGDWIYGHL